MREYLIAMFVVVMLGVYGFTIRNSSPQTVTNNIIVKQCQDTTGQGYINMMIADSVLCPDGKCKCK